MEQLKPIDINIIDNQELIRAINDNNNLIARKLFKTDETTALPQFVKTPKKFHPYGGDTGLGFDSSYLSLANRVSDGVPNTSLFAENGIIYIKDLNGDVLPILTEGDGSDHIHPEYITETEGDSKYSQIGHNHNDLYYTENEVNSLLAGKSDINHTHPGGGSSDHGSLSGLSDDDHTQYHNDIRGDARYLTLAGGILDGGSSTSFSLITSVPYLNGISMSVSSSGGNMSMRDSIGTLMVSMADGYNLFKKKTRFGSFDTPTYEVDVTGTIRTDNLIVNNDGGGSGIDADLLDGQHGSYYEPSNSNIQGHIENTTGNPHNIGLTDIGESYASINYWTVNGSNIYRPSGNVGFGQQDPEAPIHIGNSYGSKGILLESVYYADGSTNRAIEWAASNTVNGITGKIESTYNGTYTSISIGSLYNLGYKTSRILNITGNERVGIMTETPLTELHVNGTIKTGRVGTVGTYSNTEVQGIWSISESYVINTVLNDFGNQYGIGYCYDTKGGAPFPLEHQTVYTLNGSVNAAISLHGSAYFKEKLGIGTKTPAEKLEIDGWIGRTEHHSGALCGGYDNIGASGLNTNPIYAVGGSYKPLSTSLSNMFGIGYTSTSASFIGTTTGVGWGLYVASAGVQKIFMNGDTGNIAIAGEILNSNNPTWKRLGTSTIYYTKRNGIVICKGDSGTSDVSAIFDSGYRPGHSVTIKLDSVGGTTTVIAASDGTITVKANTNYTGFFFIAEN